MHVVVLSHTAAVNRAPKRNDLPVETALGRSFQEHIRAPLPNAMALTSRLTPAIKMRVASNNRAVQEMSIKHSHVDDMCATNRMQRHAIPRDCT